MKFHYYGHSTVGCSHEETTILFDPFFEGNPKTGKVPDDLKPHTILLTHGHEDHVGETEMLAKRSGAKVVGVYELANFLGGKGLDVVGCGLGGRVNHDWGWSKLVPAFHSSSYQGQYMGMPAGFIVDFGGVRIYNTGDTCVFGDMKLIAEMYEPEVLILPVGGHFTMDVFEAKKAIQLVGPKVVIPVHYNTFPPIEIDIAAFKEDVESAQNVSVEVMEIGDELELR